MSTRFRITVLLGAAASLFVAALVFAQDQHRHGQEEKKQEPPEKQTMAQVMFGDAAAAAGRNQWKLAVEKFEAFLEKHPNHMLTPLALSEAALICASVLDDAAKAAELRAKLVEFRAAKAAAAEGKPGHVLELYKLAVAQAEAGQNEEAVETYRMVYDSEADELPDLHRMLAAHRAGGLLAKLGRKGEAIDAYDRAVQMAAKNRYTRKLKKMAWDAMEALKKKP
ncbi:MAG: tetratricopeptide repeat protein [Planctomycetota bacterium]|jgi:tetratricopeptide (TPR) repeat protein